MKKDERRAAIIGVAYLKWYFECDAEVVFGEGVHNVARKYAERIMAVIPEMAHSKVTVSVRKCEATEEEAEEHCREMDEVCKGCRWDKRTEDEDHCDKCLDAGWDERGRPVKPWTHPNFEKVATVENAG